MAERKSIIPLDLVDIGGLQPLASELVSTEVLGFLNNININSSLLTDDDPLKDEYTKFLNDLGNSPIIITNEDIEIYENGSNSYFDEIDLSNKKSIVDEEYSHGNINYFIQNNLWANGLFGVPYFPIMQNYVTPFDPTRSYKCLGESMDVIDVDYSYEPSALAQLNSLTLMVK